MGDHYGRSGAHEGGSTRALMENGTLAAQAPAKGGLDANPAICVIKETRIVAGPIGCRGLGPGEMPRLGILTRILPSDLQRTLSLGL